MKISIIQGAFYPVPSILGTSVEKFWYELGADLAARGHQVVHISRKYPSLPNSEYHRGVLYKRVFSFNSPKYFGVRIFYDLLYSLFAFFQLDHSDITISNTFWFPIISWLNLKKCGRLMVSVDRMPKGQYRFYNSASSFRVPSKAVLDAIRHECPSAAKRCVLIPNPLPFISANPPKFSEKRQTILYVGRIHPEKGIDLLLNSFEQLFNEGLRGWRLKIIGPSNYSSGGGGEEWTETLKRRFLTTGLPIDWLGAIYDNDRLQHELSVASLFVYPSRPNAGEALPVAPLEAMSQGVVPIVSDLKCFDDYIINGVNGLTFSQDDSAQANLSNAISLLVNDNKYRYALASQALHVRHTHSSARITEMLEHELLNLV